MQTKVDMDGSIVDEVKVGKVNLGNITEDAGSRGVSAGESIVLEKMASNDSVAAMGLEQKKRKSYQKRKRGSQKPPDAPKRFKSSFIFFSMAKHKELKEKIKNGADIKVTKLTAMVAEAWRDLEPSEREKFIEMSRQDKLRYDIETQNYIPPPGTVTKRRKPRDPNAPKRPMSAYLMYANKLRAKVRAENRYASNGEISKILSAMWKEIPDEERKQYKDHEQSLWEKYRAKMVVWEKSNDCATFKGKTIAAKLSRQNALYESRKKGDNHSMGSIDFASDEPLLGLGSTDEIMAASTLRGVRGRPQQRFGFGLGDPSQNGFLGVNSTGGMHSMLGGTANVGQAGYGQMEMSAFPYNQFGYPNMGGNTHAMMMAQLRGNSQQFPGFMPIDQQANLSQLASLAGVQNDVMLQQQRRQLQQALDQQANETGLNIGLGDGGMGHSDLNDNPGGNNLSF